VQDNVSSVDLTAKPWMKNMMLSYAALASKSAF